MFQSKMLRRALGALVTLGLLVACQQPDSPKESSSSTTTLQVKVTGLAMADGRLSFAGGFVGPDWDYNANTFAVTGGSGQSPAVTIIGEGTSKYVYFTLPTPGGWVRPWYEGGQFGIVDTSRAQLANFVVKVPLDKKAHVVDLIYPAGWDTPKVLLDGVTAPNLDVDAQGHMVALNRRLGTFEGTTEEFTYSGDELVTWKRHYGYFNDLAVSDSVWTFSGGHLVQVVDTQPEATTTRTFAPGGRPDLDTEAALGDLQRTPATLTETQSDRTVTLAYGTENGEPTWTGVTITPTGGAATEVTVATGTLNLFEAFGEGWQPQQVFWEDDGTDLAVTLEGAASNRHLHLTYGDPGTTEWPHARAVTQSPRISNWAGFTTAAVVVTNNSDEVVDLGISLASSPRLSDDWEWQATEAQPVLPGKTTTLYFDLNRMYSDSSGDSPTSTVPTNPVRQVRLEVQWFTHGDSIDFDDLRLLASNPNAQPVDPSLFPDPNLRAVIEQRLAEKGNPKTFGTTAGSVSILDLLGVTALHPEPRDGDPVIADLTGLEYLTNLDELSIPDNDFTNLDPILGLAGLGYLNLVGDPLPQSEVNKVTAARFPHLRSLNLGNSASGPLNFDATLALLAAHTHLEGVNLWGFGAALGDAEFTRIYDTVIARNLSKFDGVEVTGAALGNASLNRMAQIPNLKMLAVWDNPGITSLAALAGMTQLQQLWLDGTRLDDLTPLKTLYDAGAFHEEGSNLSLGWARKSEDEEAGWKDTEANRQVVLYLVGKGVDVSYDFGD